MRHLAFTVVSAVAALPAFAQPEVLWGNAAGGSFGLGSNWQGGAAPTNTERGAFLVGGTYTITGPGPYQVLELRFVGGDITLSVPNGFNLWGVSIGHPAAAHTTFNLQSAFNRYDETPWGPQSVSVRNATVRGANLLGQNMSLAISDHSDVLMQTAFQTVARITLDSTSKLEVTGVTGGAEDIDSSGRLVLNDATLSFNSYNVRGQATVTNGGIRGDGGTISGGPHLFTNASLESLFPGSISGDVTFVRVPAGPSASPAFMGMSITGGRVTLRGGARAGGFMLQVTNATLDVGAGCPTSVVALNTGAVLRASGHALMDSEVSGNVVLSPNARVEIVLDALDLPATAPVSLRDSQSMTGALAVEVQNSNALSVGQQVPLLALRPDITGQFTAIHLPILHGGRALQLHTTSTMVMLTVVAGGPDQCWSSDFNGDGDFGTDGDIEAFFACLAGNCCATCARADFNSDGDTGTDADIEAFFRVLAGGAC